MKYLVTGGAGFIGSHIAERLLKEGHSVVVLDDFSSGSEANISFINDHRLSGDCFELIRGTICDYPICLYACRGVDVVLHQAALKSIPKSLNNPTQYNRVNIDGTLNMLKAAAKSKVKKFVFASSSSVYGTTDKFPEKEEHYPLLISPYALTKLAGEYYCRVFSANFGLDTVALRYFNIYGPKQALDDEYAVVIPKFIDCILNGKNPPIFGTGKQSRDFTYVSSVVDANLLAVEARGVAGQVFNIANGSDHTILELVDILNQIIGKSIEPVFLPPRSGDVMRSLADISKAKQLLGYQPNINFLEGLRRSVQYFSNQRVGVSR